MSVRLRTKWLWVRITLLSLKLQIWHVLRGRSSLTFRQTIECRFTLNLLRDMIITYKQKEGGFLYSVIFENQFLKNREKNTEVINSNFFFVFVFFSISIFFDLHWPFRGQQVKGGEHLYSLLPLHPLMSIKTWPTTLQIYHLRELIFDWLMMQY